jgi:hypothetical protein
MFQEVQFTNKKAPFRQMETGTGLWTSPDEATHQSESPKIEPNAEIAIATPLARH